MGTLRRIGQRLADERGATLVELGVGMGLLGIVGVVVMSSLSTSARAGAHVDDQTRGIADLQVVSERLSRDLRAARGVDELATGSQLTIWIDTDADYRREDDESITWRIRPGSTSGQYDVERIAGPIGDPSSTVQIVGESLVSDIAFSYVAKGVVLPPETPELADAVRVSMEYDAVAAAYARSSTVSFDVRLRNAQ